jgi:hypothetical protein
MPAGVSDWRDATALPPVSEERVITSKSEHLDAETCRAKAAECRALGRVASEYGHQIMLEHMAETWDRVAKTYENGADRFD